MRKKKIYEDQKANFERNKNASFGWIKPLKEWINSLSEPVQLQNTTDFLQIKSFTQKVGTNHELQNKKAPFDLK